jgi:hypothetical protein
LQRPLPPSQRLQRIETEIKLNRKSAKTAAKAICTKIMLLNALKMASEMWQQQHL